MQAPLREIDSLWNALLWSILKTSPSVNVSLRRFCASFDRTVALFSRIISLTVTEMFMTLIVPSAASLDATFARRIMLLFSLNLCASNALKNMLRLPRPRSPDGQSFLSSEEGGFGFPSLHCSAGMALPRFFMSSASPLHGLLATGLARQLALAWPALIGFARLHLGVHSLPDVAGGWLLGFALAHHFARLTSTGLIERFLSALPSASLALPVAVALVLAHPRAREPGEDVGSKGVGRNTGKDDDDDKDAAADGSVIESSSVIGCSVGAAIAIWRETHLPAWQLAPLGLPRSRIGLAARFALALACTGASKSACKPLAKLFIAKLFDACGRRNLPERVREREEAISKVFCYTPMAWVLLDCVPALCA